MVKQAKLESYGCEEILYPTDSSIVLYSHGTSVRHVSVIEDGCVKSKLGHYEIVRHSKIDVYYDDEYSYGSPVRYYTDPNA